MLIICLLLYYKLLEVRKLPTSFTCIISIQKILLDSLKTFNKYLEMRFLKGYEWRDVDGTDAGVLLRLLTTQILISVICLKRFG